MIFSPYNNLKEFSKLSDIIPKATKESFGKQRVEILVKWNVIVGDDISHKAIPKKVFFPKGAKNNGILYLDVYDSYALEIQHLESVIIEKIALYFGYKVISKLKLIQITGDWT